MEKFIPENRFTPVDFDPFHGPTIERIVPTTEAQREVFIASSMGAEASCAYNESVSLELKGELDKNALESAVATLVQRHEALRGCISADGLRVIIQERDDIRMRDMDLSGKSSAEQQQELAALGTTDMAAPFDLLNGPVLRMVLVRLSETEHLLRITGHHVLVDGWSLGIIMADLSQLYSGKQPEEAIPFSEYALAVIDHAKGPEHDEVESYWLNQFKGTLPRLDLPVDKPRSRFKTFNGKRIDVEVDAEFTRKLRELATRSGSSLVTTLLTAFELLIYRITGDSDLVVGLPAAGQNDFSMKELVGHCVNLLALRSRVDDDKPFIDHLKERRSAILDATDNQKYTFGTLVRKLNVPREAGRIPLVPVVFNVDMNMDDGVAFDGLQHRFISNPRSYENFELFLNITGNEDRLVMEWSYNTDLFREGTVRQWISDFHGLLERAHAAPSQQIGALLSAPHHATDAPLPPTEWSGGTETYPHVSMDELFETMCEQFPTNIAVEILDSKITYTELQKDVNALAAELVQRGLQQGEPVGICLDRCIGTQTAMLAVLKAGGCYVPFDLSYPEERIQYMLDDAKVKFMLTQAHLVDQLPGIAKKAIMLDAMGRLQNGKTSAPLITERKHTAESPAYIMYTSGSTGEPKGVIVPHRGVVRLVRNQNYMQFGPDLVFLQMGNLCFDASTFEIWGALLNGAKLVVQPQQKPTLSEVVTTLRNHKITSVLFPTGLFNMLVDEHLNDLRGLKNLVTGGDVMSPVHARKALKLLGPGVIVNAYGPTENSVIVTCHAVDNESQLETTVPIGKPISNTQAYILDGAMRPVSIGVTAELYAGGDGVALGYWGRKELTEERFVPDPFRSEKEKGRSPKLYRTGDLARWLPNGTVEFMGRADNQVKLRGFRIELGEIEAAMEHAQLKDRVVLCRTDAKGQKQLVAYLVPKDQNEPEERTITAVRDQLLEKVPAFMVPSSFVVLPAFPLNQSGKVDRKALPAPSTTSPFMRTQHVGPRSAAEKDLAAIWNNVLGTNDIGIHDNFFDLGGHSLLGIQLLAKVEQHFGIAIPLNNLFLAPTVAELAALVQTDVKVIPWSLLVPIQPEGSKVPLFCIHGDEANNFLPKYLGTDQPFYAISHQGDDGLPIKNRTVEDMAAHSIAEIRMARPHGPYILAGYSFGGILAFEIARQLVQNGESVPLVILLDTYAPEPFAEVMSAEEKLHGPAKKLVMRGLVKFYRLQNEPLPPWLRNFSVIDTYDRATYEYEMVPYQGEVTMIRAEGSPGAVDKGWKDYTKGNMQLRHCPGTHFSMITEPHVQVVAQQIELAIQEVMQRAKSVVA